MGMPAPMQNHEWTVEMVHALPDDGNRYEVIDGELFVTPAPTFEHQEAVIVLCGLLRAYASSLGLWTAVAPAEVYVTPRRELQPDLLVMPKLEGRRPARFEDVGRLTLAVEVLSPSTVRADRFVKRRKYQELGVPEYWVVDLGNRLVERWRLGADEPEVLSSHLLWQPEPHAEALEVDLPAFFAAVCDP